MGELFYIVEHGDQNDVYKNVLECLCTQGGMNMGAINYGSSEVINLGYNLKNYDSDEDYDLCSDCYEQVEWLLDKQYFNYYEVKLEGGYYEGFYLDIEFKYLYLDNYKEKLEALKEATKLGNFLRMCVQDFSMVVYYPGWCTGYEDKKTTIKLINAAIREEKKNIRALYTDKTLTKEKWRELVGI